MSTATHGLHHLTGTVGDARATLNLLVGTVGLRVMIHAVDQKVFSAIISATVTETSTAAWRWCSRHEAGEYRTVRPDRFRSLIVRRVNG